MKGAAEDVGEDQEVSITGSVTASSTSSRTQMSSSIAKLDRGAKTECVPMLTFGDLAAMLVV